MGVEINQNGYAAALRRYANWRKSKALWMFLGFLIVTLFLAVLIFGLLFTAWGVAGIIGPRIGGVLYDHYHDYKAAFYTTAVLAAIALLCELLLKRPAVPAYTTGPAVGSNPA